MTDMWPSTVSEDTPKPGGGEVSDRDTDIASDGGNAEPERWPREETVLGILLRLPATWVR
jgi:hypothetical protein